MTTLKETLLKAKASLDGFSGRGGSNTRQVPFYEVISNADLALTFNRRDALLKVLKDRTKEATDSPATIDYAIRQFSSIITRMTFGQNEIGLFEEGLKQQIEESIKNTIATFHEKRRY